VTKEFFVCKTFEVFLREEMVRLESFVSGFLKVSVYTSTELKEFAILQLGEL
jgi:hypothetical protein